MKLLTIPEAAEASRMSVSWWRQKVFQKEVKHLKVGTRVFIPMEVVEELLREAIVEPRELTQIGGSR